MDFAPKLVKKEDKNTKKLKRSRQRRKSAAGDQSERNSEYGGGISDDGQSVMSGAQYVNLIN